VAPKSIVTKSSSKGAAEAECNAPEKSPVSAPPPGYEKRERTTDAFEEPPTKKSKRMSLTVLSCLTLSYLIVPYLTLFKKYIYVTP
jgi:hypothetical protein